MKITIVQPDILWEDITGNLRKLESMIRSVPADTDMVVLPEMFTTGFSMRPELLSEDYPSATFEWMVNLSKQLNFAICGSYIVRQNGRFFNRSVFVTPENTSSYYDKRHLFSLGGEDTKFYRGTKRVVCDYKGFRVNLIICYDLRFPVWIRNTGDYDLLICVANWPESRREIWATLLKARAIENQCFVVGVNRIGIDNKGLKYAGESMILDPLGKIIVQAGVFEEALATGEISLSDLKAFRGNFPFWKDADGFNISI